MTNNQKATRAKKTPGYAGGGLLHVIKDLNETDVLLGRGTGPSEHKGNRDFRFLIAKHTTEFHSTANRLTKSRIAEQTVKDVMVKRGRFLRRLDKSEHRFILDKTSAPALDDVLYIQVDDVTAVLKTKQAFRYCSRTSTSTPRAVALPTIGGIIPPRIPREDLVTALKQEQREEHKSLLADALPLSRAHQVLCEQLQAAEMEVKSAAMLRRMWQNELLAQQQEHQARLFTSSLIAAPTSRFFLCPPAHTSTNSSLENTLARASTITSSPPRSALVTSAGLEGEGPAQPHAILAGRSAGDYIVQQHGRAGHFVAGRPVQTRPTGNPSRGAGLLLSLLDQQARPSAAARMKIGCEGGRFDLPSMSLQPRLSASTSALPSRGLNAHPAAYRYRLHDKQLQF